MDYDKENLIHDFADRTLCNLKFIDQAKRNGSNSVFEVTQLINSLLGILVLPAERYLKQIPETPLTELVQQGWPEVRMIKGRSSCRNLRKLIKNLRHAVAHFNIETRSSGGKEITSIVVWNKSPNNSNEIRWKAELGIDELRRIADSFLAVL
jgi:hypothetical protein